MAIDRQESPYRRGNRYDLLPIPMVTEHCIAVDAGAGRADRVSAAIAEVRDLMRKAREPVA
jgi:hypothetical protein